MEEITLPDAITYKNDIVSYANIPRIAGLAVFKREGTPFEYIPSRLINFRKERVWLSNNHCITYWKLLDE